MLNFLSAGNQKQIVGLALTPGIGLEAVVLDKTKNCIVSYGRKKVDYNFSSREVQDTIQFKTALAQLVDEMKIPAKTMTYLVLPNVLFDFLEAPSEISKEELKTIILSEAEQFYLFKREEPVSGWCEVVNAQGGTGKKFAYASFQKNVVDELKEIITDVGLQLTGIESANSATLRGLYITGMLDDVILEDSSWTAMLINTNSYVLIQMESKNIIEYNEVPLAIKSFSTEEAYQAIVSSASQLLSGYSSMRLYIISQTDDICAQTLKKQMQFDREIVAIDSNRYAQNSLLEVTNALDFNDAKSLTLAAIGAASPRSDFGFALNVLADDPSANMGIYFVTNIGGSPVEVTAPLVQKVSIAIIAVCVLIFGALWAIAYFIDNKAGQETAEYNNQISNLDAQIQALSQKEEIKEEIDMTEVIDDVAQSNVTAISFYDSIASDIPKNVWLTQYYNKSGNKLALRGIAENIVDIYEYYKNLRIVSPQSDIRLTELKVITPDGETDNKFLANIVMDRDIDRLYSFEISNTSIAIEDNSKGKGNDKEGKNAYDENNLLSAPPRTVVEETSGQMTPEQ